MIKTYL